MTIHLRSVLQIIPDGIDMRYPFNVPFVQAGSEFHFDVPVTFLVGENGSGKSTFLESLACATGLPTVGAVSVTQDPTLASARELAKCFRLQWTKRIHRGFFLRAEDFFGYVKQNNQTKSEMKAEIRRVDETYQGRSQFAINQAKGPFQNQLGDLETRYGDGLDARSHGESFLAFFQNRFVPGGLYLLDEPEVPLSPLRQLTLLALLKDMAANEAQFIIATHSPIIMALPGAEIFDFDASPIGKVAYQELEHVNLTRDFLNNPGAFLRHL